MNEEQKRHQLRKYKTFATGLFVLMAVIFIVTTYLQKQDSSHWIGYVRAFSEAAMVGALADWFAVTALFYHPLGLKIPHTNLIQNKKDQIGDNLGSFVVSNFLSPQSIRPYIKKLAVAVFVGEWLSKNHNQQLLIKESSNILLDIVHRLDDDEVVQFISEKAKEMSEGLRLHEMIGSGLEYVIRRNDHQKLITSLAKEIKEYVVNNQDMVQERVKKESFVLIPKFVDNVIAEKITRGISEYFEEVEQSSEHQLRNEVTSKLLLFSDDLKTNEIWEQEFREIKSNFLKEEKLQQYSRDLWNSIKKSLVQELESDDSVFKNYLVKNISEWSQKLQHDEQLKYRIDHWIRVTAYKYILKNTHQFGQLISNTVENWEGKALSDKLELEVGKDLQFIRVNGTLVGGLVGLVIYTITHFFI